MPEWALALYDFEALAPQLDETGDDRGLAERYRQQLLACQAELGQAVATGRSVRR